MNPNKFAKALTDGLLAGYGGKTIFTPVKRGSFELKSSHYEDKGIIYHDEWTNGGGQEIISVDNSQFTRVYAGGVANQDVLQKLGITQREVIAKLIDYIQTLGDKTRLFESCRFNKNDNWTYEYQILDSDNDFKITVGKETIFYHDQLVFIHVFVLSPIAL